jgi:hypothetical protein
VTVLAGVVVVGIAAARLTRFLVSDDLLEPWRSGWLLVRFPPTPPGDELTERRWRHKVGDLLSCPFCLGFYASGGMLAVAHAAGLVDWPLRRDLVLWWAVATVQVLANLLMERLDG